MEYLKVNVINWNRRIDVTNNYFTHHELHQLVYITYKYLSLDINCDHSCNTILQYIQAS